MLLQASEVTYTCFDRYFHLGCPRGSSLAPLQHPYTPSGRLQAPQVSAGQEGAVDGCHVTRPCVGLGLVLLLSGLCLRTRLVADNKVAPSRTNTEM